jgi:osmoprotectant transport system ATP-binding protein
MLIRSDGTDLPKPGVLELRGVTRRFGRRIAVDKLDLSFAAGTTTALVGSSGSGKSTVLRLLLGLESPDSGEIRHLGQQLNERDFISYRRTCGYVLQQGGLFPHLSTLDNLLLLPQVLGWDRDQGLRRVDALCVQLRIDPQLLPRRPATLSGGQRQRIALARALVADPPVLLLDEPLGALDPISRRELQIELRALFKAAGKTVIIVTHDLAEAAFLAPRLVLMNQGRIVQDGDIAALREHPAADFVADFVRASQPLSTP